MNFKPPREVLLDGGFVQFIWPIFKANPSNRFHVCVCYWPVCVLTNFFFFACSFQNEKAFQKQPAFKITSKFSKKKEKQRGKRYVRKVGLGFKIPRDVSITLTITLFKMKVLIFFYLSNHNILLTVHIYIILNINSSINNYIISGYWRQLYW